MISAEPYSEKQEEKKDAAAAKERERVQKTLKSDKAKRVAAEKKIRTESAKLYRSDDDQEDED